MAFSVILRKSVSTAVPLAARLVACQRFSHAAAVSSLIRRGNLSRLPNSWLAPATGFPSRRHFSASSMRSCWRSLSRKSSALSIQFSRKRVVVKLEECDYTVFKRMSYKESYVLPNRPYVCQAVEAPENFPFKIEDVPGENVITLEREYQGDTITVEVNMPHLVSGEPDDDDDADEEKSSESSVPLVVRVAKKSGAVLEFTCTAFPDEITIEALSLRDPEISEDDIAHEGPDFSDLDENLQQKAFHKYLEIRGIKPSTTNFLHEYMINKDSKEYLKWLGKLKNFVGA